jgi:O-succinylbenzoate synthase
MIDSLLSTLRVVEIPLKTKFRGITTREVALMDGEQGPVEFSPFLEYDDQESARWLQCTLEAAKSRTFAHHREEVHFNGTIPESNNAATLTSLVQSFSDVQTFKVKVSNNVDENIARITLVKSLRPDARIRIDVNGTWSVQTAVDQLTKIVNECGDLEYVEQPCTSLEELRELKSTLRVPVKIAADEVIRKAANPLEIDLNGAADVIVLKVQPLGGIERAVEIAEHFGLPAVVSSALESTVGLNYGVELAKCLPSLSYDCGLATGNLFASSGVVASPERHEWWKNRIMRCAELVDSL